MLMFGHVRSPEAASGEALWPETKKASTIVASYHGLGLFEVTLWYTNLEQIVIFQVIATNLAIHTCHFELIYLEKVVSLPHLIKSSCPLRIQMHT